MNPLCWLLAVQVLFCDPSAQQYAEAVVTVPPEHWQLARFVLIGTGPRGAANNDGLIILPAVRRDGDLRHEVGHLVAFAHHGELGTLFELLFWQDGQPRWHTPSRYARSSPAEDFAESYRALIEGKLANCCAERARWMREMVPGLAAYEGRTSTVGDGHQRLLASR